MKKQAILFTLYLLAYLLISGSVSLTDLFFGAIVAFILSIITCNYLVKDETKLSLTRLLRLIKYLLVYIFVIEPRAHLDVIKRIITSEYKPGIVEVPYYVVSDYSKTLIAHSITNTPGTVVVSINDQEKKFYVHWINVKTVEPLKCRAYISQYFEENASKIFD
ncbi:MAG: Na+/H+ antiporter subunit E [Staphylothermus sp.]|nr:Na+/H+ antiporter subunit E [Staphylothermus sp.]